MNKILNKSRGQIAVLYAGIVAVLIGAVALGADVTLMYVNWQQMQKTVDAAAIAGANYLTGTGNSFPAAAVTGGCAGDDAQKAACTYALANGLNASNLTPLPSEPTASTILVTATNTNLPYFFGQALGLSNYAVTTVAKAQVGPPGTVPNGLFPVGLECAAPCNLASLDPGQPVTLGAKFVGGLSPGNWGWLAPDGPGGSSLKSAVENGSSNSFSVGDQIDTKPGGTVGPISSGLSNRLSKCPALSPDPCSGAGNPTDIPKDDPCLVVVPAVDFTGSAGKSSLTIEGFAEIYIDPAGTTDTTINGCFVDSLVPTTVAGGPSAPALGPLAPPVLIQ